MSQATWGYPWYLLLSQNLSDQQLLTPSCPFGHLYNQHVSNREAHPFCHSNWLPSKAPSYTGIAKRGFSAGESYIQGGVRSHTCSVGLFEASEFSLFSGFSKLLQDVVYVVLWHKSFTLSLGVEWKKTFRKKLGERFTCIFEVLVSSPK